MYIKEKLVFQTLALYMRRYGRRNSCSINYAFPSNYPFCQFSYLKLGLQACLLPFEFDNIIASAGVYLGLLFCPA